MLFQRWQEVAYVCTMKRGQVDAKVNSLLQKVGQVSVNFQLIQHGNDKELETY